MMIKLKYYIKYYIDKLRWFCNYRSHCSCWFDGIANRYWGYHCKTHDLEYQTIAGKDMSKLECDWKLAKGVNDELMCMGYVMFIGLNTILLPFSVYYWLRYRSTRNPKHT